MTENSSSQKRVILWSAPRSTSTAFFRAMMNPAYIKTIHEPYAVAYILGPERTSKVLEDEPVLEKFSYAGVKSTLEADYAGYQAIFVKDLAFGLTGKLNDTSCLPNNYIHTFIIRNPTKVVPSYYRMCTRKDLSGYKCYQSIGMKELYEIFKLATDELGQKPIVIDSDDLLNNPEATLNEYCNKTGILYEDSMIHWRELPEEEKQVFEPWGPGWFETVFKQKGFRKPNEIKISNSTHCELGDLSKEALNDLEEATIYYNKLLAFKLQISNN